MKRTLTLACFCLTFWAVDAQLADGTKAPAFTVTDIDGVQHNLYDYLNDGKTVVIDIFATWCGPCWTLHQGHILENLYEQYGPDGTDEMMVISIEGDASTTHADLLGTGSNTWGDWTDGITFPIVEDSSIPDMFDLTFWPSIFLIRPSGAVILANDYCWDNYFDPGGEDRVHGLVTRGANDVLATSTQTNRIFCGTQNYTGSARVKNMGTDTLTSATVNMMFNGELVQSKSWAGSVTEFKTANVFFTLMPITETTEITFEALMPNGQDDLYPADNTHSLTYSSPVATTNVEFSITTDFWPEEIGWELQDPLGAVLYSDADFGTLACDETYNQTFVMSDEGCYKLVLTDDFGDGLLNGSINPGSHSCNTPNGQANIAMGAISLISDGVVLFDNISYGSGIQVPYKFDMSSAVQPIAGLESVQLYPNPAQSFVDLELNLNQNTNITMQVLDINGKTLMQRQNKTYAAGVNTEHIDVSDLANGTYFVRLTEKNNVNTLKFTVIN